jgi:predicted ATP-grasp superfamily ATP-dependent carboligase
MQLRPIVKAAFKVDELVHQFQDIDVPDGYLQTGSVEEVNEKYDDAWIIAEAENKLDIAMDPYNQEEACWQRDAKQLRRFIKRFRGS